MEASSHANETLIPLWDGAVTCSIVMSAHARRSELRLYSENTVSSFAADSLTPSHAPFYPNCSSLEYLHLLSCFCGLRGTVGVRRTKMLFEIRELEIHAIDFDEHIAPGIIDFGPDFQQSGELSSAGRAEIVREHHGKRELINDIRVTGDLRVRLDLACARCMEPMSADIARQFDLLSRAQGRASREDVTAVTSAEPEISY